jgi:GT2 family glycosyltransferase
VLGFVACGAVVRRSAFLAVGGFALRYGIGGEEELLALDLAAAGWGLSYCAELVAHHHPSTLRPPAAERRRHQTRNALRSAWLRRRPVGALRRTVELASGMRSDAAVVGGALADAIGDLGWIARDRRPIPPPLERRVRLLSPVPRHVPGDRRRSPSSWWNTKGTSGLSMPIPNGCPPGQRRG